MLQKTTFFYLLISFVALIQTSFAQTTAIPDSSFEQRLIDLGLDDVIDGSVLTNNINGITTLSISNSAINDLTGIEGFVSLTTLNISDTTISSLDLSTLTNLTDLTLTDNSSLSSLSLADDNLNIIANDNSGSLTLFIELLSTNHMINLTGNEFIIFTSQQTSSLTLSSNTITSLGGISSNSLTSLDLTGIPNLSSIPFLSTSNLLELNASNTNLSSLDTTSLINLTTLNVSNTNLSSLDTNLLNNLTTLNVSNTNLSGLFLSSFNNLSSLDVTGTTSLTNINVSSSSLTTLDLSTLTNLTDLTLTDNSSLSSLSLADDNLNIIANDNSGSLTLFIELLSTNHTINLTGNEFIIFTSQQTNSLTLSSNTITFLGGISSNSLTSLDLTGIPNLSPIPFLSTSNLLELNASNTNLSSLDTTSLINLITLNVSNTNLSSLDTTSLINLTTLNVSNTNLSGLFLSTSNNLSSLDVTGTTSLTNINVSSSSLTTLDLSTLTNLIQLNVSNNSNLIELNVQNGNNINMPQPQFNSSNTPNLSCIQVDNVAYSTTNWTNVDSANTFSTDCGFTLGVDENELDIDFSIYPNPVSDVLNVSTSSVINSLKIYDLKGKLIIKSKNTSINTSFLPSGIYILKIETENGIENRKIIKK